jgi:transcriptional regulator with XRE-family HTH domain
MSQSALADRIGITFQQVQKYEKGVNRVGAGRLVRVAAALDVPVMTLLDGIPGVGRRTEAPAVLALIAHAQPLRLVHAFAAIDDKVIRRSLMMLTEGIARLAQSRRAVRKG